MQTFACCQDPRDVVAGRMEGNEVTMSKSGILDVLKDEEKSLQTQLVAIQRAIEAIEGAAGAPVAPARGRKKAAKEAGKVVAKPKRQMTEEQRKAVGERMRNYWASKRAEKAES